MMTVATNEMMAFHHDLFISRMTHETTDAINISSTIMASVYCTNAGTFFIENSKTHSAYQASINTANRMGSRYQNLIIHFFMILEFLSD